MIREKAKNPDAESERRYMNPDDTVALLKTFVDAHTLGISNAEDLLRRCGIRTVRGTARAEQALERLERPENQAALDGWLKKNRPDHLSLSYRLDPQDGARVFRNLYRFLRDRMYLKEQGGFVRFLGFAGLPEACDRIFQEHSGRVILFRGDETPREFLELFGVPPGLYPASLVSECEYDKRLFSLADSLIRSGDYDEVLPPRHDGYREFGTRKDTLIKRLDRSRNMESGPVIRSHIGPYLENRREALKLYHEWVGRLASAGYLDVLSIGSSQLTQSAFEQDWTGLSNGGGVPVRTREEYYEIYEKSRPMLVRTYAGASNVPWLARIHEESLNIAWHAFSFWWFDRLDGRGPNGLLENLEESFAAARYAADTEKPVEANVPHHFAFRGSDDVTYIVSAYLAAKAVRELGVRTYVVQNMLNTPRLTWGIQDLAKSRALLRLLRTLESPSFRLVFQTRAGLSFFSPDIEKAKRQLAAVTFLMDDIEPDNPMSPDIIHVVGYSEANYLADPDVVNESIKITLKALSRAREARRRDELPDTLADADIQERTENLYAHSVAVVSALEKMVPGLYSPMGFYRAFREGWLPVPQLWGEREKYPLAADWKTELIHGGFFLVDEEGKALSVQERIERVERRLAAEAHRGR